MMPRGVIIPVFVPHLGCPNDCVFCNQRRISGAATPATAETVLSAVETAHRIIPPGKALQLAFYGGSFTAISIGTQTELLDAAQPFLLQYENSSIRVSTRPDCIDADIVSRLRTKGVAMIELGAQSMCNDVLALSRRGHTADDVARASGIIKAAGMQLILQMMTGLPGDTPEKSIGTARKIIRLAPDGVRIYPTVIVRDTELYDMWRRGEYREHTVEDAVALCAELYAMFEAAKIPVIRLGLNPTEELSGGAAAGGAYHPAFGELVYSRVFLNRARVLLAGIPPGSRVTLAVAKSRVSVMTGQRRCNIEALTREFALSAVKVISATIGTGEIEISSVEKPN